MADERDDFEKLGFDPSTFAALEADFENTLAELSEPHLERFKAEYETLHRALKKSHESEKRLIKKCRELNAEIVNNAAKVQTALKLSQEDQNTIASLKREIEKAWKMVDASHEKEARAKETISQLKSAMLTTLQVQQRAMKTTPKWKVCGREARSAQPSTCRRS